MKKTIFFPICLLLATSGICQMPTLAPEPNEAYEIVLNNRPLVKINGKTFSVMDVKKRMDLFLHEHHPDSFSSNLLLFQFYSQQWRPTLQEMIDNELIKMEASSFNFNISEGDIRQEMDKRFGPNVTKRLDELQLSFDDAKELVKDEIIIRNMSWFKIWAKVLQDVTPELIKSQYENYLATLPLKDEWTYKVTSLRGGSDPKQDAEKAYMLLVENKENSEEEKKGFTGLLSKNSTLNVSEPITVATKDLAPEVLNQLENITPNTYSKPIPQISRQDGSTVYRMFYLIEHKKDNPPKFEEISSKIHESLIHKYGDVQRDEYFRKLRKKFYVDDLVVKDLFPQNYGPFSLSGS